jgi:hypothetical protein
MALLSLDDKMNQPNRLKPAEKSAQSFNRYGGAVDTEYGENEADTDGMRGNEDLKALVKAQRSESVHRRKGVGSFERPTAKGIKYQMIRIDRC